MILPPEAAPLLALFAAEFTAPTARFHTLFAAALLTTGRSTVAGILRTLSHLAPGHVTAYRRVLARHIIARLPEGEAVRLVGDDTVDGHTGRTVHGKGRHRDPVRSSHSYTAWRYGHKWVVLAVLVKFPFAKRPCALPVLVDLDLPPDASQAANRRHRTPARRMGRLLIRVPGRRFVFAGDSAYGTHEVARFCRRHHARLTLVSKLHPDANRYDPPGPYQGIGRPRVKGARRAKPSQAADPSVRREELDVAWYGGGRRAAAGRGRRRVGVLAQGGPGAGAAAVGERARPDRHAPGRVLLRDRPDADAGGDHRLLLRAVEHRDDVSGDAGPPGC